jgi:AAA15 family ATPase/GTPase
MIIIKSIEIYNFRSIVKLEKNLTPNDLNIIVGQNDIGKSNFLKALNLFFNGETELKTPFRFSDDFSRQGVTARKKHQKFGLGLNLKHRRGLRRAKN